MLDTNSPVTRSGRGRTLSTRSTAPHAAGVAFLIGTEKEPGSTSC